MEACVLMGVLGVLINDYSTCCCYLLSIVVDFMILSDLYCFLFWVGRWYLLSTCVLYWPLLVCFLFIICGVQQTYRRLQLNRNSSQSSSHQILGWSKASSLDWIFFFMSGCLEVLGIMISLSFRSGLLISLMSFKSFTLFLFLLCLKCWGLD